MFFVKYRLITGVVIIALITLVSVCFVVPLSDTTGPTIQNIKTSSKVLAKSDCIPTSITITADVADSSGVKNVTLWYRVGEDQNFAQTNMTLADQDQYTASVKALDIPGGEYGAFEFYIIAQDKAGNQAKSSTDKSVQLLACVG